MVLPEKYLNKVLALLHDNVMNEHQGAKGMLNEMLAHIICPGIQSDVKWYVRSCDLRQWSTPKGRVGKVPLGNMLATKTSFQRVAMDVSGPLS